jgi:ribosomal protein L37AE/L43A
MAELKPCPICEGKANLKRVGDNKNLFVYQCSECGFIKVKTSDVSLTPWGAKRVRNKRTPKERGD